MARGKPLSARCRNDYERSQRFRAAPVPVLGLSYFNPIPAHHVTKTR